MLPPVARLAQARAGYRLSPGMSRRAAGGRVAIVDDAVNAGTAVQACFGLVRESGAIPVAVGALLALGRAAATVEASMSLPCYAAATLPSQVWPATDCPLCVTGIPLTPADGG
jgi:orotate phosphoribosyltransferase